MGRVLWNGKNKCNGWKTKLSPTLHRGDHTQRVDALIEEGLTKNVSTSGGNSGHQQQICTSHRMTWGTRTFVRIGYKKRARGANVWLHEQPKSFSSEERKKPVEQYQNCVLMQRDICICSSSVVHLGCDDKLHPIIKALIRGFWWAWNHLLIAGLPMSTPTQGGSTC